MTLESTDTYRCVNWAGKAISVNEWHGKGPTRIYAQSKYKEFIDSLAWTIKAQLPGIQYSKVDMIVELCLGAQADHHNFLKPILDAVQKAGVVENDIDIETIILQAPKRHRRGEADEIILRFSRHIKVTEF